MKLIVLAFLICATAGAQDDFQQQLAASNYKAASIYPASVQKESFLYKWITEDAAFLQTNNPDYFKNPDWPYQITLNAVSEINAREWGKKFTLQTSRTFDQIRGVYKDAILNGYTAEKRTRLVQLFSEVRGSYDYAKSESVAMRPADRDEFLRGLIDLITVYNKDRDILDDALGQVEHARSAQGHRDFEAMMAELAQRPKQYNGQPLPANWIDPQQADFNFFMQQLQRQLQQLKR